MKNFAMAMCGMMMCGSMSFGHGERVRPWVLA